jgi:hypothetical protein
MYTEFIRQDHETYSYTVTDFAENTRAVGFHASELSGCLRRLVYAICGTEKKQGNDINVNMKMRFRHGTGVHAMLQNDFSRMAQKSHGRLYFQPELKISPELQEIAAQYDLHSHCDGVFTFCAYSQELGQWYPYLRVGAEIKTQSDGDFESTKEPKADHKDQTCIYMKCLDLPLMWTLYYNKSNCNITAPSAPWLFQFDEKRWNNLVGRMHLANGYKERQELPPREVGMPCSWCPYSWHCQPPRSKYAAAPHIPPSMLLR